jgi:hypothetical protein
MNRALIARFILGMMISTVAHEDWLFGDHRPGHDHLLTEMVDFTLYGIAGQVRADLQERSTQI